MSWSARWECTSRTVSVSELTRSFGCWSTSSALALNGSVAFVTATSATLCDIGPEGIGPAPTQPTLVIPLDPLIMRLQQHMLPIVPTPSQAALPFPPEAIRSRA